MRAWILSLACIAACAEKPKAPATHNVKIEAFQFSPTRLEIARGDKVIFTNADATPHTVTPSVSGSFAGVGRLLSTETGTVVIEKAGAFEYFCELHTTMKGTIVVK